MNTARSLRQRLLLAGALTVAVVLLVIAPLLYFSFSRALQLSYDQRLDSVMLSLIASVEHAADGRLSQRKPLLDPAFERPGSGWYWQISSRPQGEAGQPPNASSAQGFNAQAQLRSRSLWDRRWPQTELPSADRPVYSYATDFNGNALRVAERSIRTAAGAARLDLVVVGELSAVSRAARQFAGVLGLALFLLIGALWAATALQVRFGLQPLRRVRRELEQIHAGEQEQIQQDYPAEIAPLTVQINELLQRNRAVQQRARQRTADLAHALKMPLGRVQAEAQSPTAESWAQVSLQTQRISQLLDQHLTLAASGAQSSGSRVAVAPICDALAQALHRIHGGRAVPVDYQRFGDAALTFRGDAQDLEEMLGNLLDNAWKWTRQRVVVHIQRHPDLASQLRLEVRDDGPGLSTADQLAAVQRGVRFDECTPGSGLGLHIVAQLAADYGGSLELDSAAEGGLLARLLLPAG